MKNENWVKKFSTKQVILITVLWALGITLLVLSSSNLFTEKFFQEKNGPVFFMMITSSLAVAILHHNFWKQ
jgi:hypothetical protein